MPKVTIWGLLKMQPKALQDAKRDVKKTFEQAGGEAGDAMVNEIAKKLESNNPKIRRAANALADRMNSATRDEQALSRSRKEQADLTEHLKKVEGDLPGLRDKVATTADNAARAEADLRNGRNDMLTSAERLAELEKRATSARSAHTAAVKEHKKAEKDVTDTVERSARVDEQVIRNHDRVTQSIRKRAEAHRRLADEEERHRRPGRNSGSMGVVGNMLTDLPFVPSGRAGAAIGGSMLLVMSSMAEAAVTASQSIALLPAATAMAAAGIGTLAVGMQGFGDAMNHMGDPKKFAEAIQSLSPAAQQAALEIKYLTDGPLKDLKNATQETLFKGVAEELHNLTGTLLPQAKSLTEGVAGSFNSMFHLAANQLQSPQTMQTITNTVNNIVQAFHNLEPAIQPIVVAITRLSEAGSQFLPGLATDIANAAKSFGDFITKAQADGSLHDFLSKGIEAAKYLVHAIMDIGKWIYQTFGGKSPEEFRKTIDTTVESVKGLVQLIVAFGNVLNDVMPIAQNIANAIGGWENLIIAVSAGAVVGHLIKAFTGAETAVGGIASALRLLPGVASEAGAGMAAGMAGPLAIIAAGVAAIGVSIYAWQDGMKRQREAEEAIRNNHGEPGIPISGPIGPKIPGSAPNLPGSLTAPGSNGGGNPLDAMRGGAQTSGPKADYKDWYGPGTVNTQPNPLGDYADKPVPDAPSKLSKSDQFDAILASTPLNMPDLGYAAPGMPGLGQGPIRGQVSWGTGDDPYGKPGYGYYEQDPTAIYKQFNNLESAGRELAVAQQKITAIQAAIPQGLKTQQDLIEAQWAAHEKEKSFHEQQLEYAKELNGKWQKISDETDNAFAQLGAGLDKDFGVSKGLAGMADNLVRFIGKLATAPLVGALTQITGGKSVSETGSGLLGAFGPTQADVGYSISGQSNPLTSGVPVSQTSSPPVGGPSSGQTLGINPSALPDAHGAKTQVAYLTAIANSMGLKLTAGKNDHVDDGLNHPKGLAGDFSNGSGNTPQELQFAQFLSSNFGDLLNELIYSDPAFSGTIFNGQPHQYDAGTLADHRNHVHASVSDANAPAFIQRLMGMNGSAIPGLASGLGGPGAGVVPVYVTNMGGGGFGGGGTPLTAGGSSTANPGGVSAGAEGWRDTVAQVVDKYGPQMGIGTMNRQRWIDAIVKQIDTESGGDPNAQNPNDSDGHGGTQSVSGLLQYLPQSYAGSGGKLTGLPLMDPIGQIAGALFAPRDDAGGPSTTAPGAIGMGHGWGPTSAWSPNSNGHMMTPTGIGGGSNLPGTGMPNSAPFSMASPAFANPGAPINGSAGTNIGGNGSAPGQYEDYQKGQGPWQPKGGALGMSGLLQGAMSTAISAAGMGADAMGGGGGGSAAAQALSQMLIQGINRTIQLGGSLAGDAVGGIFETLGVGGSPLADPMQGWAGRVIGGLMQAAPALAATAGDRGKPADKKDDQQQQGPGQAQQAQTVNNNGQQGGIQNLNMTVKDSQTGQSIANDLAYKSAAQGSR